MFSPAIYPSNTAIRTAPYWSFLSSRRRNTRYWRDWSSDVCSSDLVRRAGAGRLDSERDPRTHTWSATINDEGILSDRVVDGIFDSTRGVMVDTLPLCSATENGRSEERRVGKECRDRRRRVV